MDTRTRCMMFGIGLAAVAVAACGSDSKPGDRYEGPAAQAAAAFFRQELTGGQLPVPPADVQPIGIEINKTKKLDAADNAEQRYCMPYAYFDKAFKEHVRVYVVQLVEGGWSVRSVRDEGTCEGVA